MVQQALAHNPPAALLPRKVARDITLRIDGRKVVRLTAGTELLLAIGSGTAERLEKTWGFRCDSLALEYARHRALVQALRALIMPVRAPVAENAALLKTIIAVGAPCIEFKLAESRQVHFTWFLLPDNDSPRGLLGLFFCASLEDQFEHLLGEWANKAPMGPDLRGRAKDPLIGQHADPHRHPAAAAR